MDRKEAKRFWLIRYENAKDFSDPHWEARESREHREYVEALRMAIEALSTEAEANGDLISRADAIAQAKYLVNRWIGVTGKAYEEKVPLIEEVFNAIPSAKVPTKCVAEIKIDADEVAQKIKEKYDLDDRPSVAYICDGTACDGKCDECHHTTDIEHAKNFKCVGGKYIETDDRPTGEWIIQNEELKISDYRCSVCGHYQDDKTDFCPNCGAKMGGGAK